MGNQLLTDRMQTAELINDYHMHEVLGSGAYGVVHKATKHGIDYAVKCMSKKRLKKKGFSECRFPGVPVSHDIKHFAAMPMRSPT